MHASQCLSFGGEFCHLGSSFPYSQIKRTATMRKTLTVLIVCISFIGILLLTRTGEISLEDGNFVTGSPKLESVERMIKDMIAHQPCCQWDEDSLVGKLRVDLEEANLMEIRKTDKWLNDVKHGGTWRPKDCKAKSKVAIIIPFRKREHHLTVLLKNLHPILQRQKLDYRIFVISQDDKYPFNRAKLFNIGFNESLMYDNFDCFVFHDVDLIPEDDRNDYGCPSAPRHMCPAVSKFQYILFSPYLFGGVTAFRKNDFISVNGYANKYYGWGSEDDDLFSRVEAKGMRVVRPPLEVGRYTMIVHKDEERNSKAESMLKNAVKYMDKDGLNSLRYTLITRQSFEFYTKIGVDVEMTEEEKRRTSLGERDTQMDSSNTR